MAVPVEEPDVRRKEVVEQIALQAADVQGTVEPGGKLALEAITKLVAPNLSPCEPQEDENAKHDQYDYPFD